MTSQPPAGAGFDAYATDYEAALRQGVSLSGEDSSFFVRGRVAWLGRRLDDLSMRPRTVLDFGCGTGSATPHLLALPSVERVIGVDVSSGLLEVARREHGSERATFATLDDPLPSVHIDLAYCNGVFHHIPPAERGAAVDWVRNAVGPGGPFALWENNPWNPGTRLVMRRIPFDRDAITLTPPEARRLLASRGFAVLRADFQFVFPRRLRWLRGLEPALAAAPFGAQYMVLGRAPEG